MTRKPEQNTWSTQNDKISFRKHIIRSHPQLAWLRHPRSSISAARTPPHLPYHRLQASRARRPRHRVHRIETPYRRMVASEIPGATVREHIMRDARLPIDRPFRVVQMCRV